jgi:hypothetical protein
MKVFIYLSLFLFGSTTLFSQDLTPKIETIDYDTLTLKGKYNGKNIFVKNPFRNEDGFSVQSVMVDKEILEIPNQSASAFEINLSERDRKIGQDLDLMIIYLKGRKPEVLNAEVLE